MGLLSFTKELLGIANEAKDLSEKSPDKAKEKKEKKEKEAGKPVALEQILKEAGIKREGLKGNVKESAKDRAEKKRTSLKDKADETVRKDADERLAAAREKSKDHIAAALQQADEAAPKKKPGKIRSLIKTLGKMPIFGLPFKMVDAFLTPRKDKAEVATA